MKKNESSNQDFIQCVTFLIGNETYGIDVKRAREVMYMVKITEVPNTLPFMKGVMDLRGAIVPLVDTRIKFKIEPKEFNDDTVVIILELENKLLGLIVDAVSDVMSIPAGDIQEPEHFTNEVDKDYVSGISRIDEKLIIILDVDKIFSEKEIRGMSENENVEAKVS